MKKILTVTFIIALVCIAMPLFAQPEFKLSAGGGGIFNIHWYNATLKEEYRNYTGMLGFPTFPTMNAMANGQFDTKDLTVGGGFYGFFDATYAVLGAGLVFNKVTQKVDIPYHPVVSLNGPETHKISFTQLNLSLMLKYPFAVSQSWKVFPMAGVDWQIALGNYDSKMKQNFQDLANSNPFFEIPKISDFWNSVWIRAGAGADYSLTERLFLRSELLYGFKLNSKFENKMKEFWDFKIRGMSNGFHVRLGLGYAF